MPIRKTMLIRDRTTSDDMGRPCTPQTRVAALFCDPHPFAGVDQDDLTDLVEHGALPGAWLAAEAAPLHPRSGIPVRAAIGGGQPSWSGFAAQ